MSYLNFTSICQLKHKFVSPLDAKFTVSRKKANFGSKLRFRRVQCLSVVVSSLSPQTKRPNPNSQTPCPVNSTFQGGRICPRPSICLTQSGYHCKPPPEATCSEFDHQQPSPDFCVFSNHLARQHNNAALQFSSSTCSSCSSSASSCSYLFHQQRSWAEMERATPLLVAFGSQQTLAVPWLVPLQSFRQACC